MSRIALLADQSNMAPISNNSWPIRKARPVFQAGIRVQERLIYEKSPPICLVGLYGLLARMMRQVDSSNRGCRSVRLRCPGPSQLFFGKEHGQQLAYRVLAFEGMPQGMIQIDPVAVASPHARSYKDLAVHQVLDYFLGRPLGNADAVGDFPHHHIRISGQTQKNMGMVVQKGPLPAAALLPGASVVFRP
jgi:hypothetical protein